MTRTIALSFLLALYFAGFSQGYYSGLIINGSDEDYPTSVCNTQGGKLICGAFKGTVDFQPGPGTYNITAPDYRNYLVKYDATGAVEWANTFDVMGIFAPPKACYNHNGGGYYVAGAFFGLTDFDPGSGTNTLNSDNGCYFVAHYLYGGELDWVVQFGTSLGNLRFNYMYTNQLGVIILGEFSGQTDFEPGNGTTSLTPTGLDGFAMCLTHSGAFQFADATLIAGNESFLGGTYDGGNDISYACGYSTSAMYGNGGWLPFHGASDGFATVLDPYGIVSGASTSFGGFGYDEATAMAVDAAGNVYVTGQIEQAAQFHFNGGNIASNGGSDVFLAKYGLGLNTGIASVTAFGGAGSEKATDMRIVWDSLYLAGEYSGAGVFSTNAPNFAGTSNGSTDIFVGKYGLNLRARWVNKFGGAQTERLTDFDVYQLGLEQLAALCGTFEGTVDFDPSPGTDLHTAVGINDGFYTEFLGDGLVSAERPLHQGLLQVYPNPCQDVCSLRWDATVASKRIRVVDVLGKVVWEQNGESRLTVELPSSNWPTGSYHVSMVDIEGNVYTALMVKN